MSSVPLPLSGDYSIVLRSKYSAQPHGCDVLRAGAACASDPIAPSIFEAFSVDSILYHRSLSFSLFLFLPVPACGLLLNVKE